MFQHFCGRHGRLMWQVIGHILQYKGYMHCTSVALTQVRVPHISPADSASTSIAPVQIQGAPRSAGSAAKNSRKSPAVSHVYNNNSVLRFGLGRPAVVKLVYAGAWLGDKRLISLHDHVLSRHRDLTTEHI